MAGLSVPLDEVIHFDVVTHDPATGGRVTATSITFDVFEEATDTAIRANQTLTQRAGATGVFRGTDTISAANGYEVGKYYSIVAEATAGGVVGQAVPFSFRVVAAETVVGISKVDLTHLMGTILTEGGAGRLAAAFIKLLDVATPTLVASDVMRGTDNIDVIAALEDAGLLIHTTTIDTLATQTSFTLVTGPPDNDVVVGLIMVIEDATTAAQKTVVLPTLYVGSTRTVTLPGDPDFIIAVGDKVRILPVTKAMANRLPGQGSGIALAGINVPTNPPNNAGGLLTSTVGNLDMDAKLANTNEITVARMAELDPANLPADIDTLLGRMTSTLFAGITSLAEWLGLLAGKQTGDATARTEIRATGVGSGTFDETTESLEAIKDLGDSAWITATGFSTHNAAAVWASGTRTLTATGLDLILKTSTFALAMADANWDEVLTGATHNVPQSAGRRLRGIQDFQGYDNGQIWVDTVNGTAGTVDFENGTVENSVKSITDAKIIATSVGLSDFHIINGSTIVLGESTVNESYFGDNWILDLGGRDIKGAYFSGADISGVGTSLGGECHFEGCTFATASIETAHADFCSFEGGTVTFTLAADYNFHNCYSKGDTAPIFTKTSGQAVVVEFHNWSGDITISGIEAGDTIELGGNFRTIILSGSGGTVHVHGHYETISSGGFSGALSITGATKFGDAADILVDTGEIGSAGAGLTSIFTTALTESYRGTGATGSAAELLYEIMAGILDHKSVGLVKTIRQIDGSDAKTYTYDDDTNPTEITETT